ncbi:phosphoserine phosphatase SerB [Acetobacteraceae bacterium ESL0709]|nr:phosphoserine phosphatase SerB [Acetobacteraceae bacterium ESL0697]MDF7677162.1 phosphoserine phosphatase SerB [Acetobacteraceae bacterium ESL0709]
MSFPDILTLVVDRRHQSLSTEAIDIARHLVKGVAPVTLSEGEAVEIACPAQTANGPSIETIRATLAPYKVDAIITKARGRRKAVLIADMDSTILTGETLDDLAEVLHLGDAISIVTKAAMNGEIDFETSLRQRTQFLAGVPEQILEDVYQKLTLNDGAFELVQTMKAHGARTALISGGFTWYTQRIAARCGFDENYGNVLDIQDGKITGKIVGDILGPQSKREHLDRLCEERGIKLRASLTTGDGSNDIPMLEEAGLGIAFRAKPVVRRKIAQQVNFSTLRAHLFAQGYPASAFTEIM